MHGRPTTRREVNSYIRLYRVGESTRSIAKKFSRQHTVILWHLRKLNIRRRGKQEAAKLGVLKGRIPIFKHQLPPSSKDLSYEKAYIIGVLCGDGYISYNESKKRYQIGLNVTNKEFIDEFKRCLYKVYKLTPTNEYRIREFGHWQDQYVTRLCSKAACEDLLRYCKFGVLEWSVSKAIVNSNREMRAYFLRGLYDSKGDVDVTHKRTGLTSINKNGLDKVADMLNNLGIRCTILIQKDLKPNRQTRYVLRIQDRKSVEIFYNLINFTIKYKHENLRRIIKSYKLWVTPKNEIVKHRPLMKELRKKGFSYEKIARQLNIGTATVWHHLKGNI